MSEEYGAEQDGIASMINIVLCVLNVMVQAFVSTNNRVQDAWSVRDQAYANIKLDVISVWNAEDQVFVSIKYGELDA